MRLGEHEIRIREALIHDAPKLSEFIKLLDSENDYLLYDKNERKNDLATSENYLSRMNRTPPSIVFIAMNIENDVVGFVCGEVNQLRRFSHVMKANIGILKKYYNTGLGRLMSNVVIEHAKKHLIVRLEVSVISKNKISLNLCKKLGLEVDGVKKSAIKINNSFYDEILLSKILLDSENHFP